MGFCCAYLIFISTNLSIYVPVSIAARRWREVGRRREEGSAEGEEEGSGEEGN